MKRLSRLTAGAIAGLLVAALIAPAQAAPLKGEGEGLKIVANIDYTGGTDMEWAKIKGRDYAFVSNGFAGGDEAAGFRVIDITKPNKPKQVAFVPCRQRQGDIQLSWNKKYLYMANDTAGGPDSCLAVGKNGFQIFDIRNPKKPKPVGYAETGASHNITAHPKKPYVYNSSSALAPPGEIQIWKVKNPKKPELVNTIPSLPHAPHDISFNKKGDKIVTAAISHFDLFDTSDPENPSLLWTGQCPGCSITHDAKWLPDDSGLLIGDEGGGGLPYPCPGGALYFYQIQGGMVPVLTGVYEPDEFLLARDGQTEPGACTSHVMELSDDGTELAISWYSAGTRYLDIAAMTGVAIGSEGGGGVEELGWFMPDGGTTWSSKFLNSDGKYIFSNDMDRGFDVFKIQKD
jgi:hypothetical protein